MDERYYTVDEIAERLHLNRKTVLKYIHTGRLRAIRLDKLWLCTDAMIQEYLHQRTTKLATDDQLVAS